MAEVITQHYDYTGDAELLIKQVYGRISVCFLGYEVDVVVSMPDGSVFNKFIPSHADEALVRLYLTEKLEEHLTSPNPAPLEANPDVVAPIEQASDVVNAPTAEVVEEAAAETDADSDVTTSSKKSKNK